MTPHTNAKQRALHRTHIIQGQLRGIERMLTKDAYCVDILTQSLAVQKSLRSLDGLLLKNHLETCVLSHMKSSGGKKYIDELIQLYGTSTQ